MARENKNVKQVKSLGDVTPNEENVVTEPVLVPEEVVATEQTINAEDGEDQSPVVKLDGVDVVKLDGVVIEPEVIGGEEPILGVEEADEPILGGELGDEPEEDQGQEDVESTESVDKGYLDTFEEIQAVLYDPEISVKDSLEMIANSDLTVMRMLVVRLLDYNAKMGPNAPIPTDKEGAKNNFDLYTALKNILKTEDEEAHMLGMDIINIFFIEYSNEAFNEVSLARFDNAWTKSPTALKSYQYLVTVIAVLAYKGTRKDLISTIDINKFRNDKVMDFSAKEVDRLVNYYHA